MTATTRAFPHTVNGATLNPTYGIWLDEKQVAVTHLPGGFWAVKVRQRGGQWIAFAVPRLTTIGDPFLLAVGDDRQAVFSAAMRWRDQAVTIAGRLDRVVFAGYGNATHERLNTDDIDGRWAVLDTQERR
ncbi:hypothetical protein [Micromonospora sp. WMMD737]|uniref:hypothetical protein n=1 Tax=Micromonospora sp. WMMD737 TaxID=3404113 RepID=UPI003B9546CB